MAKSIVDYNREHIIRGGFLKHRETGFVSKWRQRYIEFKFTQSGRIAFVVYKDQSASPANEVTQVLIEEYGGLDSVLKLDGEKHVFAIITTHSTECFATESLASLREWVAVIQEYFGKELVMNINVPHKQNVLRAGKGQIRIRNTGFTITTNDCPPKCQCTWQILHIRKFGGSETFRFETGSKCPSGEYLYCINTEDNAKMKSVFRDLSVHKPIFADDRMGRRMTHEHNMLQKMRTGGGDHSHLECRFSVPSTEPPMYENHGHIFRRRVSVPHNATSNQSFQSQSNAFSKDSSDLRTSAGGNLNGDRVYCNVESSMPRVRGNHTSNSLPTSPNHRITSPERSYYNLSHYSNSIRANLERRAASRSPNDSDSDDDFVNVPRSIQTQNEYYNLRDALASRNVPTTDDVGRQMNYENFVPPGTQPFPRSPVTPEDDSLSHSYTNLTVPPKLDSDCKEASISNERLPVPVAAPAPNTSPPLTTKPEATSLSKTIATEAMASVLRPSALLQHSNSEEDDGDEDTRNRTTSIVGNVLISSDFNSRSCEDLTAVVPPFLKTIKHYSSGNFSDSELLSDQTKEKPKPKSHRSHVEIVPESQYPKVPQGKPSRVVVVGERNGSLVQNKRSRPAVYDHLVPLEQQVQTSQSVTQSLTFVPSGTGMSSAVGQKAVGGISDDYEHASLDSQHTAASPDHTVLSRKETTFERKAKVTRRQHLYEDVDLPDEAASLSCSSSPESGSSLSKQQLEKMSRYQRKISYTGRLHSYEDVASMPSELQDLRSESSTPEAPSDWVLVPSQLPGHSSTYPHSKAVEGLSNTTRRPLPLQQVDFGDSVEDGENDPEESLRPRVSKKPVPTPRRGQKREDGSGTDQHLPASAQQSLNDDSNAADTADTSGPRTHSQVSSSYVGVDTSGSGSSLGKNAVPPALPPKPGSEKSLHPSLPRIPNKPRDIRCDPNYMLVDIVTTSASATLPAEIKSLDTNRKRDDKVVYSQISHFKTEQLEKMIVERKKAKSKTNLKQ